MLDCLMPFTGSQMTYQVVLMPSPYFTATSAYIAWLKPRVQPAPFFDDQLFKKAKKMDSPFAFLRGTFYRWAALWPQKCPLLAARAQDAVLGVGDLHAENFGVWPDKDGKAVWGVNDFDEVCRLPFTSDLVRLATSMALALESGTVKVSAASVCKSILKGYQKCCAEGGREFLMGSMPEALHDVAQDLLEDARAAKPPTDTDYADPSLHRAPSDVTALLAAMMGDDKRIEYRMVKTAKGLGSIGRPRYVALQKLDGEWHCVECKVLVPSAVEWRRDEKSNTLYGAELLGQTCGKRQGDPSCRIQGRYVLRHVGPQWRKTDMQRLADPNDSIADLLVAMGAETANIHLAALTGADLLKHLDQLASANIHWMLDGTRAMLAATRADYDDFRRGNQ
jgi:Uncharacterized protein conserved in bacteria (DUF2252)